MMLPQLHQRDEQDDASHGNAQSPYRTVYNWFTEGFDRPDLIEFKVLLDELP